jgi:xanthine phosphoribosyltransferase
MSTELPHDYRHSGTHTIDWATLHRDVSLLAELLRDKGPFSRIVAIARGGLVPAALLSRMLDQRLVDTVCISSYDDKQQREGEPILLKGLDVTDGGAGWLVVDDLADSGKTLRKVRELLPAAHIATVYTKPVGAPLVDTVAVTVDQSVWLVFPWDLDP